MEYNFRIETTKGLNLFGKECVRVFKKNKKDLPQDIDVENRFGVFCEVSEQYLEELHNFEVRKDDVWVITTPKSGTTWMLEMVWILVNNFDYETAMKIEQTDRCPYFEYDAVVSINPLNNQLELINNMKSPRIIKSHLPMHMLPKGLWTVKPKIVYVARDPKDGIVSFYHFVNRVKLTSSSLEAFVNNFLENGLIYNPFWTHVAEFWNIRNEPNIYFSSFERMKKDLRNEVIKVSKLLGKTVSKEQLDKLVEHLTFDKMKDNQSCNNVDLVRKIQKFIGMEEKPFRVFMRKGEVGSYKEELSEDLIKTLEEWTQISTKSHGINPEEILLS